MLSFKDLVYFAEVAESLTLSRASERLGISQPSLSLSVKRLEQELDIQLINRSKAGVSLTPAGREVLAHTQKMLDMWQTVKSRAHQSTHEVQGRIRFGCHPSVALHHLPSQLPQFLHKHPRLDLKIEHDLSRNITESIINLKIDVGLVVNPVKHPDLVIIKVRDDVVGFWRHPELDNFDTLLYDSSLLQSVSVLKQAKQDLAFKRFVDSQNLELLALLAKQKAGIAILPESLAVSEPYQLVKVDDTFSFSDEICIIFRHENRFVASIQALVELFR